MSHPYRVGAFFDRADEYDPAIIVRDPDSTLCVKSSISHGYRIIAAGRITYDHADKLDRRVEARGP